MLFVVRKDAVCGGTTDGLQVVFRVGRFVHSPMRDVEELRPKDGDFRSVGYFIVR